MPMNSCCHVWEKSPRKVSLLVWLLALVIKNHPWGASGLKMGKGSLPQRRGLKCELAYCDLDNNYEAEHSKQAKQTAAHRFFV